MLIFSQKHRHPSNDCEFLGRILEGILVKRREMITTENLVLGIDELEKQKGNTEVAQCDNCTLGVVKKRNQG